MPPWWELAERTKSKKTMVPPEGEELRRVLQAMLKMLRIWVSTLRVSEKGKNSTPLVKFLRLD